MSIISPNVEPAISMPAFPVRRFSVDEYHRMIDAGVLAEEDRVELLEGWIVPQMVRRPRHDATIELVEAALRARLPHGYRLRIQSAITTVDSEPEPDLALVKGTARDHMDRHPRADEVGLVVEVADTTLARDREKCRVYARAGVPHYWIVNLPERQVEVFSQPTVSEDDGSYAIRDIFSGEETLGLNLDDSRPASFVANELLP